MKLNLISGLILWNMIALDKISKVSKNFIITLCYHCENFNDYSHEHMFEFYLSRMEFFNLINK